MVEKCKFYCNIGPQGSPGAEDLTKNCPGGWDLTDFESLPWDCGGSGGGGGSACN